MLYSSLCLRVFALFETLFYIQATNPLLYYGNVPQANHVYYRNCAPAVNCNSNSVYRTFNGRCNNLKNPLWGSTSTPYVRLVTGVYSDGDHAFRYQTDGTRLPGPRELQLALFLYRSRPDFPDIYNYHVNQFGQWTAHDITLLLSDTSGPKSCCDNRTPPQCQEVIEIPANDPVYSKIGQRCMEFRRAMTSSLNYNCKITPQISMNQATSFIDSSQLYGHTPEKAASLRTYRDGRLITENINGQEFNPQQERSGSECAGRNNVDVCFDGGDPRLNQHFGITLYHTMFTRFHNYITGLLKRVCSRWTDEVLYQETRRIIGAANQIMVYRDYLPILLGKQFTERVGLAISRGRKTRYDPLLMPQLSIEFTASAFRVPHNILPSTYKFINENYNIMSSVKLNEWMSKPDPIVRRSNFDDILRGMTQTPGRAPKPSYNYLISNFMFRYFMTGNQDLLSVDIQRGRDAGVPTYNRIRKLCGFPKATSFKDLADVMSISDIRKLEKLYASIDDVDLLVGALLEPPCPEAMVGPTARCVIADVFYRLRYGDRFFFDVENQPGSFSHEQLNALRNIDLGHVFCAGSGINEVPFDIYGPQEQRYSGMRNCKQHLYKLDFSAWRR